jgi:TonB family protein
MTPVDPASQDRHFLMNALAVSLAAHLLLMAPLLFGRHRSGRAPTPINKFKLSYTEGAADHRSRWLSAAAPNASTRHIVVSGPKAGSAPSVLNRGSFEIEALIEESLEGASSDSVGEGGGALPGAMPTAPGGVVDLTNVTAAAQGNPVRLAYFTAIREQVQQTADHSEWMAAQMQGQEGGLVYVQFGLDRGGDIRAAQVVSDVSDPLPTLRDTALQLVRSSAPFPAFPPSFAESSLTILLPIEFSEPGA